MNELTIIIDSWSHKELKEYLMSLNGISSVTIKDNEYLSITIKYDINLITPKIIKMEIFLFLNIKIPSILSFDKNTKEKTEKYTIVRNDICCDYCLKGAIEDLFDIEGIENVISNYNEYYSFENSNECKQITISISYNPNMISFDEMKKIETSLTL